MKPLRLGVLLAVVVAGPPLWAMVQDDQLDGASALERWAAVAAICSLAASGLAALVRGYEQQAVKRRREEIVARAAEAIDGSPPGDPVA